MIYHCIRIAVKPEVTADQVDHAIAEMRLHSERISAISSRIVGRDHGGDFDFGAVTVLADLAAYEEYMNHPAHLALDRLGLPLVERFVSYDITDDLDPAVRSELEAIHRRRFTAEPDVAALVSQVSDYQGSAAPESHAAEARPRRAPTTIRQG